jgi:hypothetical protein
VRPAGERRTFDTFAAFPDGSNGGPRSFAHTIRQSTALFSLLRTLRSETTLKWSNFIAWARVNRPFRFDKLVLMCDMEDERSFASLQRGQDSIPDYGHQRVSATPNTSSAILFLEK